MTEQAESQVLEKEEILRTLAELKMFFREYHLLLEGAWESDEPGEETLALLNAHRSLFSEEREFFSRARAVPVLLRYLLPRIRRQQLVFHLADRAPFLPEEENRQLAEISRSIRSLNGMLEERIGGIFSLARDAPGTMGPRLRVLLGPIASLFKAILRQDWEDVDLIMNHINVVTTSRRSHEFVEHIGRLVRSIHDSLHEISQDYPIESLSHATEEIPDAVEKLGSIIVELEQTANRNLDILEALSERVGQDRKTLEETRGALEECGNELAELARENPSAGEALSQVENRLQTQAIAPLSRFQGTLDKSFEIYMSLFANQSYQDLTGQTLKKVIAFIEGLQYQLIQAIAHQRGRPAVLEPLEPLESAEASREQGPDARNRLSQDKVDHLLAELGF